MRGLALCLVAGALVVAGCGSSDSGSKAPASQQAASKSGTTQSVGVGAAPRATPASLCQPEGVAKPKKQCTKGLNKLAKGKAKNPAAACKGLSKKKTKGVHGKSPYAVCVSAAAKLMASKTTQSKGNGSADSTDTSGSDTSTDGTDTSTSPSDSSQLVCTDANGNDVPPDDPNVEDCTDSADASASGSGSTDSSGDSTDSSGDTSTDSTDSGN